MLEVKIWLLSYCLESCLAEASLNYTNVQTIRELFVSIIRFSYPSKPYMLWDAHENALCDDILREERIRLNDPNTMFSDNIYNMGLYKIEQILNSVGCSLKKIKHMTQLPSGI